MAINQISSLPIAFADEPQVETADKPNSPTTIYDLVAVIVDTDLDKDTNPYNGLKSIYPQFNAELTDTQIGHRILRYGEDIRKSNDLTDVKIILFDKKKDSVVSLSNALENLYRNGDGTHKNRLSGVVLVGDIPLPVVNKNGNRYVSMFPYTDFSDKAYIYNGKTKSFEKNGAVTFPKPEIWHGVIKAPSDDVAGKEKLAEFFDKNHLYYAGEPMFSKFDRKMFFGDLVHEDAGLNIDVYKQYVKYLSSLEDLAYMRYNKFWASALTSQATSALKDVPADIKPKDTKFLDSITSTNPMATVPDIYSKQIIDQNLTPYFQVLSKYISQVNDFSDYTARYAKDPTGKMSVDSVAGIISIKDEYTKFYLKSVNDALEKKTNEVIQKIQEPLNLLDYSNISGELGGVPFDASGGGITYRFGYRNEQDDKFYIDGIQADTLQSPKECMPLLGSTKSEYYDSNLAFNPKDPKIVDGKYSILTRSIRSDNFMTSVAQHTTGVNTRMLSPISVGGQPAELFKATGNAYAGNVNANGSYDSGAIIEDNQAYGISAFIHNRLAGTNPAKPSSYLSPLALKLQKGDVIVKVNGKNINSSNSFEQAIEDSYSSVKGVIDAVNNKQSDQLKNLPFTIKIVAGQSLEQANILSAIGYFSVSYYHGATFNTDYFSFTVNKDGSTSTLDAEGPPEIYVILDGSPSGKNSHGIDINFDSVDFYNAPSDGAIFTLYDNKADGYNGGAYDPSAGCNANSTSQNSDRCFGMVAAMPVLDPAGSVAPVKAGNVLKFPERSNLDDSKNHVDSYQFPAGYKYEDVDNVYYNACYKGLPSVSEGLTADANPYAFVLDSSTNGVAGNGNFDNDFYGRLLKSLGQFSQSNLAQEADYEPGVIPAKSSNYNPRDSIWLNTDKLDASQIVLNSKPKVTLKDLTDRFGLFDGVDNNGDGKTDFIWKDTNNDGVADARFYDYVEADSKYGIPSSDLNQIARKILSHDGTYVIPYGSASFPYNDFSQDLVIQIKADTYKQLSSIILHNEPTDYTISQQLKAQSTYSLPIDNPRYIAFQSQPKQGPIYPTPAPVDPKIDVDAIKAELVDTNTPTYVGETQKVKYVNLFDSKNMAQLQADLASKAAEIAAMPGSYRIFGPNEKPSDHTVEQISEEILNNNFAPVVSGINNVPNVVDDPADGFNLQKAATDKVYDALNWLTMNIDEKHQYILQRYLSGDAKNGGNAYVADKTLLPAPSGYQPAFGYEAAYLELNGQKDTFDMSFNKNLPEEKDPKFDPLVIAVNGGGNGNGEPGNAGGGAGAGVGADGGGAGNNEYQFVWIQDFLKEMQKFVKSLSTKPTFENACIASEEAGFKSASKSSGNNAAGDKGAVAVAATEPDPNANKVELHSYVSTEISGYDDLVKSINNGTFKGDAAGDNGANGLNIISGNQNNTSATGNNSSVNDSSVSEDSLSGSGAGGVSGASGSNGASGLATGANGNSANNKASTKTNVQNGIQNSSAVGGGANGFGGSTNGKMDGSGNGISGAGNGTTGTGETTTTNGSGSSSTNNSGATSQKDKDLEILKSTLVPTTNSGTAGPSQKEAPVLPKAAPSQSAPAIKIVPTDETQTWTQYFILNKYYQKFIPSSPQSFVPRWIAALPSENFNPFEAAATNAYSKYVVEDGDTMTADGVSLMKIEADVYDSAGQLDTVSNNKVRFSISSDLVSFVGGNIVDNKNGIATISIKAGTVSGDFTIKAEVLKSNNKDVDTKYQVVTKDLHLEAGEPTTIAIQADSGVLVANNQSKTTLNFILKDKFGNIATNSLAQIAVFVNDVAQFDAKADTDSQLIGTEVASEEGKASVDLYAKNKTGEANVVAVILDPNLSDQLLQAGNNISGIDFSKYVGATKTIKVLDKAVLSLHGFDENFKAAGSITADGKSIMRLSVELTDSTGSIIKDYNGPVKFTVLQNKIGKFITTPPTNMVNGVLNAANVNFQAATLSGDEEILVEIPGFTSDSFKFKVNANIPSQIDLTSSAETIDSSSNKVVVLQAWLLDQNGNLVDSNNGTEISFDTTAATKDLVTFDPKKAITLNGVAAVKISAKNLSGVANIIAQSDKLPSATISLKITKHVVSSDVQNFSPRALYISLLGGDFGNTTTPNNLANTMLFSGGQVEAISSVTATQSEKKRMFGVDAYGKIDFLTDTVNSKVVNSTNTFPYQKILLSDDLSGEELANVFVVPKVNTPILLMDDKTDIPQNEGLFVKSMNPAATAKFKQQDDGIYLNDEGDTKFEMDKYGRIFVNDKTYTLRVPAKDDGIDTSNFSLILSKAGADVALIVFKQNFNHDVQELDFGNLPANFVPGVYIQAASDKKKYQFTAYYSGNSTHEAQGKYLIDTDEDIDSSQAPGFGYNSLDSATKNFGLGFEGQNKHMLLFAAGNSVGNSFTPYASDSGIVYGDPMIHLKVEGDLVSANTGYSKDIGKEIYTGTEPIKQVVNFDANGDGYNDLLLVYDSGLVKLLQNENSNERFKDMGYILNIYNGIYSIAKIDVDNDGYDDLVVGTKEACNAKEQCLTLLKNNNGNFERQTLNLGLENKKAYEMKAGDMNADGCEDLVVSDSSGSVSIFYNKTDGKKCLGLDTNYGYSKNFGFKLKDDLDQSPNIFVNYPGMELPDDGKDTLKFVQDPLFPNDPTKKIQAENKSNWYKFIQFSLQSNTPPSAVKNDPKLNDPNFSAAKYAAEATDLQNEIVGSANISDKSKKEVAPQTFAKTFDFINIKEDGNLGLHTTKQSKDENGGSISVGDEIEFLIALKNDSNADINNLMLSDVTPTALTLIPSSLKCLDPGCADKLEWLDTGTSLRSSIIKNISVPAKGTRIISYKMKVTVVPEVHFDIGNNFTKYPSNNNDQYLDVLIRPSVNPDGILTYMYSTGPKSYETMEITPADAAKNALDDEFKKLGLPSPSDLLNAGNNIKVSNDGKVNGDIPPETKAALSKSASSQNKDSDYSGCADAWNNALTTAQNKGDAVANAMQGLLGNLRCSGGGCAPIPYNISFLTPNSPVTGIPGLPAVNVLNAPPWFVPFGPSTIPTSVFRAYLSPTLTLGLGTGICVGPTSAAGVCFAFAIPGGIPGVCSSLKSGINKAMTAAKSAVVNTAIGQSAVITDGQGTSGTKDVNTGGSWTDTKSPFSAGAKVNVKIPGFPSVITNWMDNQIDEIYNKLLDFPTFYFILPDFSKTITQTSLAASSFSTGKDLGFRSFHDFATSISNFPFVKIEGKEIVMKIPAISPKEIAKYKTQAAAWLKHMDNELQKYKAWDCGKNEARKTFCDLIKVDMTNLISSVKQVMDTLDKIGNLPKDILTWRNLESKYATQIICYLDAIMTYTGGYINKQEKIVESWMKTVQDTIRTFKSWKAVLDLVADYQASCDKCKSDRFSKLGLLMQLFVALPDIPVFPLPKWPDIVVDFSQIKTGVTILWPDVVFRPEPIILPNLPDITLPDVIPDASLDLSAFNFKLNLPKIANFKLPDLPNLPSIPLPNLPDLPKPPHIPALPNVVVNLTADLKFIFKILCLLKNGFVPIPENTLATEIETLTQPSVSSILPIIKNLGMQFPPIEYSYVDQIRITGKLNFDIDTNFIYYAADAGAEIWNQTLLGLVTNLNKLLAIPLGQAISKFLQDAVDKAAAEIKGKTNSLPLSYDPQMIEVTKSMEGLNKELQDYVATTKNEEITPDKYYLVASQTFINPSNPILNRKLVDVEKDIQNENLADTPGIRQMAALRDQMIAYTKGLDSSNEALNKIDDLNEFNQVLIASEQHVSMIADNDAAEKIAAVPTVTDVGSNNLTNNTSAKTLALSFLGKNTENTIIQAANDADLGTKRDLIANAINFDPQAVANDPSAATPPPIGFFVDANGVNENVLNYTAELTGQTNILFDDVDHDKDYDIVYSMGGDVYLKTNYKNNSAKPKGDLILGYANSAISDYVVAASDSVQGVNVPYINNGKADIGWLPKIEAISYEVDLRKSIYDDYKDAVYSYNIKVVDLSNKDAPRLSITIPNGNYYVNVFAITSDGKKSIASDTTVVAPQSCADSQAPMPIVSTTNYNLSIFKDQEIDASASFDPDGTIKEYYLETLPYETTLTDPLTKQPLRTTVLPKIYWSDVNVLTDEDDDGIAWNDMTNSKFNIGPFVNEGDVGKHEFMLHVVDQSGKDSKQQITINVFAPKINLDKSFATSGVASGDTNPPVGKLPFWLMRNRYIERVVNGKLKLAPRIDKVKDKFTDDNGTYSITDFNLEDMIQVENADGKIIAEINPKTGNVGKLELGYKTVVNQAIPPAPTSIDIINQAGVVLGTIYLIADANIDVKTYDQLGFTTENVKNMSGVNVDDLSAKDNFEFIKLPVDDANNPGGVILKHKIENKVLLSVDTAGNIIILDNRVTLIQKPNDHTNEPLIVEINFEGKPVGDVYISTSKPSIIVGPKDVPFMTPHKPSEGVLTGNIGKVFSIPSDLNFIIDPTFKFNITDAVTRKDFIRILLKMICVVPSSEAKQPFKTGTGYTDEAQFGDYHAEIKEATMLGFVHGYAGSLDPVTGLAPFKPENNITRAEAVQIILKALEYKAIVDLSTVKEGNPWYINYMKAAQDLTPYVKNAIPLKNNFIVTTEEAVNPDEKMTFSGLLTMAQRVLDTYNCFEVDANKNGMSDFCEAKYGVSDPSADPDKDGLNNSYECTNQLNPIDADTDKGGITDGQEVKVGTNPLDALDDSLDDDNDGLSNLAETTIYHTDPHNPDTDGGGKSDGKEVADCSNPLDASDDKSAVSCNADSRPGIYVVPPECNTCPCISTFLHKAEIIPGDIFFPVVVTQYPKYYDNKPTDKTYIFNKGNEVQIQSINK